MKFFVRFVTGGGRYISWALMAGLMAGLMADGVAYFTDSSPPESVEESVVRLPATSVGEFTQPAVPAPSRIAPVSAMAPSQLDDLARHASFTKEWLVGHGFPPGSVALDRVHQLLDGRLEPGPGKSAALLFGSAAGAVPDAGPAMPAMAQQERFVRAQLPLSSVDAGDSVIVRWRYLDDSSVMELSVQPLSSNALESQEIWMHRTQDWVAGHYRVEVLSASPDLKLLASGGFEIVPGGAPVTPFIVPTSAVSKP